MKGRLPAADGPAGPAGPRQGCTSDCVNVMKTVELVETSRGQELRLPEEFRFASRTVSIRRQGDAVILEPVKAAGWPERFFEDIRIEDPAFARPPQDSTPPAPSLD